MNERYCNPHLNSGNIQFPLHLTSPLVVKSIIYYEIIIPSPSLPTIYQPSWRQYYSKSLHWLTDTISCGKLLDKISVKWNYRRGTIFYLNIYCWQSVAGKSDMEEGLSVPVIRPENLIYISLCPHSPRNLIYKKSLRRSCNPWINIHIYIILMSKIIIIGEMLYHQLLCQSMFPLIIEYRDMIHIVTTRLE